MQKTIIVLTLFFLTGCSYKVVRYDYKAPDLTLPRNDSCKLIIKKRLVMNGLNARYIGTIKMGDNGGTITCREKDALANLHREACALNANLINITDEAYPDLISSCYRCVAEFYELKMDKLTIQLLNSERKDTMVYSKSTLLRWSDLKAEPQDQEITPGYLCTTLQMKTKKVNIWTGVGKFDAYAIVFRDASWIRTDKMNEATLQYFQLLFDITELSAIKVENYLNGLNINVGQVKRITDIFYEYVKQAKEMQSSLISETSNGMDVEKLKEWRSRITIELKKVDPEHL